MLLLSSSLLICLQRLLFKFLQLNFILLLFQMFVFNLFIKLLNNLLQLVTNVLLFTEFSVILLSSLPYYAFCLLQPIETFFLLLLRNELQVLPFFRNICIVVHNSQKFINLFLFELVLFQVSLE